MNYEKYWLCWSPRQNALHIETEHEGARANRIAFNDETPVDYVPIGVFTTEDQARAEADRIRPILHKRDGKKRSSQIPR
jgi:hypothetical protein